MRRPLALLAGLLGLVVIGLLLIVDRRTIQRNGDAPRHAAPAPQELDLEPLIAELRALREGQAEMVAAVAELRSTWIARPSAPGAQEPGERRSIGEVGPEPVARLETSLNALRASVEAQTRETSVLLEQVAGAGMERSLERQPAIDTFAVDDLVTRWRTNPEEARRSELLRTPASLIAAYGPPSEVWRSAKSGLFFAYIRDWGPAEEAPVQVGFRICDGMVVDSWFEPYEPEPDGG